MRNVFAALVLCASLSAAPAFASHDKKPVDPNKKICRRDTDTGTILSHSTCHTAAEWQAIDEENARNSDQMLARRGRALQAAH